MYREVWQGYNYKSPCLIASTLFPSNRQEHLCILRCNDSVILGHRTKHKKKISNQKKGLTGQMPIPLNIIFILGDSAAVFWVYFIVLYSWVFVTC